MHIKGLLRKCKYYNFAISQGSGETVRKFADRTHKEMTWMNAKTKELRALRDYFGPPMRLKSEYCLLQFLLIKTIAQVQKSGVNLTFTVAMVTNMAAKIG